MIVATVVLPVFALIALGYVAVRYKWISEGAHKGLAEFSATLAIPALLFRTVTAVSSFETSPVRVWIAYFGALAATWILASVWTTLVLRRPVIDSASIAMTSCYGNTVMLGIPLCLTAFGPGAAAPIAIILSIHTAVLWMSATLHHRWNVRAGDADFARLVGSVLLDLARNPLILAIFAGVAWRSSGLTLPAPVDRFLALLAQAGVPSALIALGASLTGFAIAGQGPTLASVVAFKLVVMPALAAALCYLLGIGGVTLATVVVFAAMPAGANAYLFASKTERAINSASGAVALGTLLSVATTAALVVWLTPV